MLDKVKTIIALLVGVSFSLYLLDIVGVSIPILEYVYHGKDKIINYYYLYVSYPEDKFRYCGLFIEPGYNSLVLVCMILVNNFNFKLKSTWLYLMAFICTFSLGGYILFVVGYSMFLLIKQGSISRALFIMGAIVVTLGAVTFVSLSYNGGNNYFAEKIIMRLMIDDDNGIAGNNREGLVALPIIDSFFYSNSIWMGVGKDVFYKAIDIPDFDACSWRQFVIMYGAVYTIFLFVTSVFLLKRTTIYILRECLLPYHHRTFSPNALSPTFSYARLIEFSASALSSKYAGILFVSAIFTYAKKSSIMLLINFSLAWFSFVVGGDSLGPQAHASPAKRTMTQPKPAIFVPERFIVLTSGGSRTSAIPLH